MINAITVWNTRYFERAQTALARQGVPVPEQVWQHLSTLQWAHIHLNGSYHFTDISLNADFRPLREYQGSRMPRAVQPAGPERADAALTLALEEEELLNPMQLSLFVGEEDDL